MGDPTASPAQATPEGCLRRARAVPRSRAVAVAHEDGPPQRRDGALGVGVEQAQAQGARGWRRRIVRRGGYFVAWPGARLAAAIAWGVRLLADAGMGQFEALLPEHLAQARQAAFKCLADLGLGAGEVGADAVAIQLQADLDRPQLLRCDADMGMADLLPGQPLHVGADVVGEAFALQLRHRSVGRRRQRNRGRAGGIALPRRRREVERERCKRPSACRAMPQES